MPLFTTTLSIQPDYIQNNDNKSIQQSNKNGTQD
jgi:hypothetical protein